MRLNLSNIVLLLALSLWGSQAMANPTDAPKESKKGSVSECKEKRKAPGLTRAEQRSVAKECYQEAQAAQKAERTTKALDKKEADTSRLKSSRMAAEMSCAKEVKAAGASADKNENRAAVRECADKKLKPGEDKIDQCNEKAAGKSVEERRAFMKQCMGGG